jgi:hypothetical protein
MTKTLIVYEDGKPDLEKSAKLIASGLPVESYEVRVRAASTVSIPDILASKFYFFGAEASRSPSYAEVARVFSGINLAGRSAAYFGPSREAVASLRKMAADTDLGSAGKDLVEAKPEPETVSAWLRDLI